MRYRTLNWGFSLLILLTSIASFGQQANSGKIKEIYLSGDLLKFQNLGLQYKNQIKDNTYFRVSLADFNYNVNKTDAGLQNSLIHITTNISGSFDIGLEKRKSLTDVFSCFYGLNLYNWTSFNRINNPQDPTLPRELRHLNNYDIDLGFGFNSGFILKVFKDLFISAELMPRILYKYNLSQSLVQGEKVKYTANGGSLNLNNTVQFSLIYSWIK